MRRLTEKQIRDSIRDIDFEPLKIKLEERKIQSGGRRSAKSQLSAGKTVRKISLPKILGRSNTEAD